MREEEVIKSSWSILIYHGVRRSFLEKNGDAKETTKIYGTERDGFPRVFTIGRGGHQIGSIVCDVLILPKIVIYHTQTSEIDSY